MDIAENRRSIRKLGDPRPAITLPGRGPAIHGHREIEEFARGLGV
jgi:hypothetical protein